MQRFSSFDGVDLAYLDAGAGPMVVLLHGFASDHRGNWVIPGVVDALVAAGRHVIAPDARGHGESAKPHDAAAYADNAMGRDVQALLDHLAVDRTDIAGYSMGSLTAGRLVPGEPRTRRLILGGVGTNTGGTEWADVRGTIADALLADDPSQVKSRTARAFRTFADRTGADRLALAAIQGTPQFDMDCEHIGVPTLVLTGDEDTLVGPPEPLAARIPGAVAARVHGDHLTAVADPAFARTIVEFLDPTS